MAKQSTDRQWYRMPVSSVLEACNTSVSGLSDKDYKDNFKEYGYVKPLFMPKWLMPYFAYNIIRRGKLLKIQSDQLVVGDIITLNKGDVVPALIRVVSVRDVTMQEKNHTGFSNLITKNTFAIRTLVPTGQQKNMLFPGTYVAKGLVNGVVVGNIGGSGTSKLHQSKKIARHGIITSVLNVKRIYNCNAIIFDGLTKTKDIKESFRLLYINNNIPCLYLTSLNNIDNIVSEMPEVQLLRAGNKQVEPGVYVANKTHTLDLSVKNYINSFKVLYIGPEAGQDPVSLAAQSAIVAGNSYQQINLLNTKALAVGISAKNLSSILYNKK